MLFVAICVATNQLLLVPLVNVEPSVKVDRELSVPVALTFELVVALEFPAESVVLVVPELSDEKLESVT